MFNLIKYLIDYFGMLKKNKNVVPISVLLISIMCFFIYTIIIDPYHIVIQILVFIGILILNLGIFYLYQSERKFSFMFFLLNCLLIYTYIRFSISTTFPIALVYYAIIFLGFHIFEETFTKRFLLRTKIILRGYYNNSEFVKIVLWLFFVLIPSLIKPPIIVVSVCQPLMLYCYLFEYNYTLLFFSILILWCGLLVLLSKYKIGFNFLYKCKIYFSRRACLHYIGNTLGSAFTRMFSGVKPSHVVGTIILSLGINNIPTLFDYQDELNKLGKKAAETVKLDYQETCAKAKVPVDPYVSHSKQLLAYKESINAKRYGDLYLHYKFVGLKVPEGLDPVKLEQVHQTHLLEQKFDAKPISRSFDDIKVIQVENRQKIEAMLLEQKNNQGDLLKLCERNLQTVAEERKLKVNVSKFKEITEKYTSEELIAYVLKEIQTSDEEFLKKYQQAFEQNKSSITETSKAVFSPTTFRDFNDLNLLDQTAEHELTGDDVSIQVELPERKPAAKQVADSVLESKSSSPDDSTSSKKRSIGESQSSDTEDATPESESKKLKPKK